ncbi:hypothetical protein ABIF97_004034 [Bradyrhizobium japonicum]
MGPDAVITGCIGGMTSSQASIGNEGIWLGVLSEIRKWRSPRGRIPILRDRGGAACSSVEVAAIAMERRGCVTLSDIGRQRFVRRSVITPDKPLPIIKRMVWEAYQLVALNGKAAGVDGQSLDEFARDLGNNLYKPRNRFASGSYFAPAVRRVEIPKANGGIRPLTFWPSRTASRRCWSSSIWNPVVIPMKSRGDSETTSPTFPI